MVEGKGWSVSGLKDRIAASEKIVRTFKGDGAMALQLLEALDYIHGACEFLSKSGVDVHADLKRAQIFEERIRQQRKDYVKALQKVGGIEKLRAQRNAPQSSWWWYLDTLK
jgi:hypothetical protein